MKGVIRLGDKTNRDGVVISASPTMQFDNIAVAREGDYVMCDVKYHNMAVNGIPVALDGHKCACGCALVTSLPSATIG